MGKKINKLFSSKDNRAVAIIIEVAVLLTIVVLTCAILNGSILSAVNEPTMYVLQSQSSTENLSATSAQSVSGGAEIASTSESSSDNGYNTLPGNTYSSFIPGIQGATDSGGSLNDPSGWSNEQIIAKAKDAVNKTKLYKNNLTVHHRESFQATVTECTGGSIVQSIANLMVGWVVKPVDETLNYSNGLAQNSEGEIVPIILPKRSGFELTPSGVSYASATLLNNQYVIKLNIVPENVGINGVPVHNAASIGYLDVGNFDISFMEVDSANITYSGSSIELHINGDGYVTYAVYKVPLTIVGSAHKGSISGSATFVGEQSEIWTLNY